MKVRFHQSGGYAGLLKGCEIDTAALEPQKAEELIQLVRQSSLSPKGQFLSKSSRDLHQYEIQIDDGAAESSVTYDEESVPPSARALIGYLKKCSKPQPLN